ncbi:hypothetical protein BG004_006714 [Podila humilis]|nr:hypothetical protein BG004_006714 [Podila humilis]
MASPGNASEQEWETESSGESHIGDPYDDIDSYDEVSEYSEDFDQDGDYFSDEVYDMDDFHGMGNFLGDPYVGVDIEALTPSVRANHRPNVEEDIMSEFSGDEKYEPKEALSAENGQGENDMIDFNPYEQFFDVSSQSGRFITSKIRRLMQNLSAGQIERERKLGLKNSADEDIIPSGGHRLHRLIVRGPDFPQEIEYSPATTAHYQCANSLTVTPSAMGLRDDLFTLNTESIIRCGVLERMSKLNWSYRATTSAMSTFDDDVHSKVTNPVTKDLRTIKASKFLEHSVYRYDEIPLAEIYCGVEEDDSPLCMAHRYGYLAHGREDGGLVVFCTSGDSGPEEIFNNRIAPHVNNLMLNSVQIVRWPRYDSACTVEHNSDDESNDHQGDDEQEGHPRATGQFDHYVVMAGNEYGLFIAALPDHHHHQQHSSNGTRDIPPSTHHSFKFKKDHIWIRQGFQQVTGDEFDSETFECLNDAKVSPNGQWIAVVGDSSCVWVVKVTHEPETEKQRIMREKQQELEDQEDQEDQQEQRNQQQNSSHVYFTSREHTTGTSEDNQTGSQKASGKRKAPEHQREQTKGAKSSQSSSRARLLHKFGVPERLPIPENLIKPNKTRSSSWLSSEEKYSSQYLSWNVNSTKFAHTSDTMDRIYVWSMSSKEIICCVDTGAPSFAIDFHPVLDNVFAFTNWYGFVHVVDISGVCVGDVELMTEEGQGASSASSTAAGASGDLQVTCAGPTYEEKHDILMISFRGEVDKSLRILDCIRGLKWSTDGRHLYVATLRRVLKYQLKDKRVRIPSLFQICANVVKNWKERTLNLEYSDETFEQLAQEFKSVIRDWEYVPHHIKRRIWGDHYHMRTHHGE